MSDGQRREKPKFEPPPWEREAFDQLARRRAQAGAEASEDAPAPAGSTEVAVPPVVGEAVPETAASAPEAAPPDDAQVELMLRQLREQEERAPGTERMAQVAGVVTGSIGAAMAVLGLVELVRSRGGLGFFGGMTVAVFGLGSLALGVWVWMGSRRVKGS